VLATGRIGLVAVPAPYIASLEDLPVSTINGADLPREPSGAAQVIAAAKVDIVVLGAELDLRLAFATTAELLQTCPEIDVVLMTEPTQPVLVEAMTVGVRQVVSPDSSGADLHAILSRLVEASILRRARLASEGTGSMLAKGRLISVMAAKGGVGKSTVAVNVAAELAQAAPDDVALVDLNLMAGEVDRMLGIEPKASVASVASTGTMIDSAVVKLSLTRHSSGLLVLPAPDTLEAADSIDCDLVMDALAVLKGSFRFVVVDTAPGADAALAAAVELSDDLLVIATPDLGGLRSLRRNLDGLETLGLTSARRHLVLNRADYRTGLNAQAIEAAVELPIAQSIPDTREIAMAANQGVIFTYSQTKSEAARAFRSLAARLNPTEATNRRVTVAA
jgi:pilus assembly protein CpaE